MRRTKRAIELILREYVLEAKMAEYDAQTPEDKAFSRGKAAGLNLALDLLREAIYEKPLFDLESWGQGTAIHCKTEEEAAAFCKFMDSHGKTWNWHKRYDPQKTYWNENGPLTAYDLSGGVTSVSWYRNQDYLILEAADFDWTMDDEEEVEVCGEEP